MASRVAKNPVEIPSGVEISLAEQKIAVKGKQGTLEHNINSSVNVEREENVIKITAKNASKEANALAGTTRAVINNMVIGVNTGFTRKLILIGVGYRAKAQGNTLNLTLGLSHPVNVAMPEGISVETPSTTEILIKGSDKQKVSQIAANIRELRQPEPYKGKGIRYEGEQISLKEGKKK